MVKCDVMSVEVMIYKRFIKSLCVHFDFSDWNSNAYSIFDNIRWIVDKLIVKLW